MFVHDYMSTGKNIEGHMLGCYQKISIEGKRPWCGWSQEEEEDGYKAKQINMANMRHLCI